MLLRTCEFCKEDCWEVGMEMIGGCGERKGGD